MNKTVFIVVMLVASLLLGGCVSQFSRGDQATALQDIRVKDSDWSSFVCTISMGSAVKVSGFSQIYTGGGTEKFSIVRLNSKSCTGWVIDDMFLNTKLQKWE